MINNINRIIKLLNQIPLNGGENYLEVKHRYDLLLAELEGLNNEIKEIFRKDSPIVIILENKVIRSFNDFKGSSFAATIRRMQPYTNQKLKNNLIENLNDLKIYCEKLNRFLEA